MKNSTQKNQRNSFCVEGKSKNVAEKTKLLDFSNINSESLKNLGLIKEDIDEAYSVNAIHRTRFLSEIAMAFCGPLAGCQAIVISYKNRLNVSEIIPVYLENSLINPKRMSGLGLKILDI